MFVRRARPIDQPAIFQVHAAAFAKPDGAVPFEARLVDDLQADGDVVEPLSVLAELDGQVVGHVVCSRARIEDEAALGLGPLGVLPAYQGRGVGSALMHAVLAAADALDHPSVVLLGSPRYYARFGFELAELLGVRPPDPAWVPHFQLRRLAAWQPVRGRFRYAPAFDRA